MATKHVLVFLLAAPLAAISVIGALLLGPQGAEAATVSVKTCSGGTIELNSVEKYMLERHNKARTERGLKALCVHPTLTNAARAHSQEMLDKDYTSHKSFNGETLKQRLERFGYTFDGYSYYWYGENIAWGCGSYGPERIFKFWMNSSNHRSNILNKKYREVGIGVRTGAYKSCEMATMYTVDFATRLR
jgi:uncharacterized protein YkwD